MIIAGILAGGTGTRMGADKPKQFLDLAGVPVIVRTVRTFLENENIDAVIIAMNLEWIDYSKELLAKYGITEEEVTIVPGGATRFESLEALARASAMLCGDDECLMINHDCARPFVSQRIINDNITMVKDYDMVTTSVPTIDTVLVSKDGKVSDCVPDRSTIFLDQGPQTVNVAHFLKMADALTSEEREKYMEAGRLYIDKGYRVGIVPGERENFKLTTSFDMRLAEMMLSEEDN